VRLLAPPAHPTVPPSLGGRASARAGHRAEEGAPPLAGGETYFIFTVRGEKEGVSFAIGEGELTLGEGLREGTFSGEDPSSGPVGGTFTC
jgi:hypothetical protein